MEYRKRRVIILSTNDAVKRGSVNLILLTLLMEEDKYGYQIQKELAERSNGRYTLLQTSLYPILYRLLDQGLISEHPVQMPHKRVRNYYHITDKGIAYQKQALSDYLNSISGIMQILGHKIVPLKEEDKNTD